MHQVPDDLKVLKDRYLDYYVTSLEMNDSSYPQSTGRHLYLFRYIFSSASRIAVHTPSCQSSYRFRSFLCGHMVCQRQGIPNHEFSTSTSSFSIFRSPKQAIPRTDKNQSLHKIPYGLPNRFISQILRQQIERIITYLLSPTLTHIDITTNILSFSLF